MTSREHLIIAINRAQLSGCPHFAAALLALYHREYPRV